MGRKRIDEFDEDESDFLDEFEYDEDIEEELESEFDNEYSDSDSVLEDISIADVVNEHGIDGFADAIIDSISYSDLEKLRDRINEYLE